MSLEIGFALRGGTDKGYLKSPPQVLCHTCATHSAHTRHGVLARVTCHVVFMLLRLDEAVGGDAARIQRGRRGSKHLTPREIQARKGPGFPPVSTSPPVFNFQQGQVMSSVNLVAYKIA